MLLSYTICSIYENKYEICIQNIEEILTELVNEAYDNGVEVIKEFIENVKIELENSEEGRNILSNQNLGKIFKSIGENKSN